MAYVVPGEREYGPNIKWRDIRVQIEPLYNSLHDELSQCYYDGLPFKDYGVLDKATFEALHALLADLRFIAFHMENQSRGYPVSEEEYRYVRFIDPETEGTENPVEIVEDRLAEAQARYQAAKQAGLIHKNIDL